MEEETIDINEFIYYLEGLRASLLLGAPPEIKVTVELDDIDLGIIGYALAYVKLAETVMKNDGSERLMDLIGEISMKLGDAMEAIPGIDWEAGSEALDKRYQQTKNANQN